jgi:hypothetical protein
VISSDFAVNSSYAASNVLTDESEANLLANSPLKEQRYVVNLKTCKSMLWSHNILMWLQEGKIVAAPALSVVFYSAKFKNLHILMRLQLWLHNTGVK